MKVALFILLIYYSFIFTNPFKIYITFENNELIVRLYNKKKYSLCIQI